MMHASHYVIEDILHTVGAGDIEEVMKVCRKYSQRYRNDDAIVSICDISFKDKGRPEEVLEKLKSRLKDLLIVRRIETSGGSDLWFLDRRAPGKERYR